MKKFLDNKGVSLIEVLAALVLLSIVAFPLAKTFLDGFKFQARSQIRTEANKVIEYVAEQLKKEQYETLHIKFGDDNRESIREWAREWATSGSLDELESFEISSLPGSTLTASYDVEIAKRSITSIQDGGVGTPDEYDCIVRIDENGDYYIDSSVLYVLDVTYRNGVLKVKRMDNPLNDEFYAMCIDCDMQERSIVTIEKDFDDYPLKVFLKGNVTAIQSSDPNLPRAQKLFESIKIGDKNEVKDEKEYLCNATITAINKDDDSIRSSMDVTFSVFVRNED